MAKESNFSPVRISETDKLLIDLAAAKAGVSVASKVRELLLAWARKVLK